MTVEKSNQNQNKTYEKVDLEFNVQRYFFEHEGLKLCYIDCYQDSTKDSDIPVFLLHGFSSSAENNWLKTGWINKLISKGRRVIALDARGHGQSEKVYEHKYYPADIMMKDSVALLELLNIEQIDLIGFSMGARMASFLAINYPERIRNLVIAGMGMGLVDGMKQTSQISEALTTNDLALIKDKIPRLFRRLSAQNNNDLKALSFCISASRVPIKLENLSKITANTLIITGDKDELSGDPVLLFEKLKDLGVEIKYKIIADCNHFMAPINEQFQDEAVKHILS